MESKGDMIVSFRTLVCEDGHFHLFVEGRTDLLVGGAGVLHAVIAFRLLDRCPEDAVGLLLGKVDEGGVLGILDVLEEERLQIVAHMLLNRLLGMLLHTGVNGGVYLQAIAIDVVV